MPSSPPERHALVIGAGLAGSAVCAALARRGWKLSLIDAASGPAMGASALPVGMLSPHVTRAPTPLSRLSELGVPDMRAELERLVPQGAGWKACEVDNHGHNAGRWPAALVRPAALVKAWLDEAAATSVLQVRWNATVALLRPTAEGDWQALDAGGQLLARAKVVVVAAAHGSHELLLRSTRMTPEQLPLRPVQGQLSFGALDSAPPMQQPQRNNGVYVPVYEDSGLPPQWPARIWAMGSTYERGSTHCHTTPDAHERNQESLQELCAAAATAMRDAMAHGHLLGWAQVRCASQDRLPLVGAMPDVAQLQTELERAGPRRSRFPLEAVPRLPGLFALTALGSRGLTLSHWCATQLALMIDGQPPRIPEPAQDLLLAMDPARFAWKQSRRQRPAAVTTA